MKFQDSRSKGLKVTVGTKSVTHPHTYAPTHAPKAICPINFFKVGGIKIPKYLGATQLCCKLFKFELRVSTRYWHGSERIRWNSKQSRPCPGSGTSLFAYESICLKT